MISFVSTGRQTAKNARILLFAALRRTVALEIADESRRVVPDVAVVDGLTTLAKEQQAVEYLEQFGRRLVNRA